MHRCHLCDAAIPQHAPQCRAHTDLVMFERVFRRLTAEDRNPVLRVNLARLLEHHGRPVAVAQA